MAPSNFTAVRIRRTKERVNAKKVAHCKVVSATCPFLLLQEGHEKILKEGIRKKMKSHV